jgi:hypothetical protein
MPQENPSIKICSSCNESKSIEDFYLTPTGRREARCLSCRSEYFKSYYLNKLKHTDKPKEYRQKYRKSDEDIFKSRSNASKIKGEQSKARAAARATKAKSAAMAAKSWQVVKDRMIPKKSIDREEYMPDYIWTQSKQQFRYFLDWSQFRDDDWSDIEKYVSESS